MPIQGGVGEQRCAHPRRVAHHSGGPDARRRACWSCRISGAPKRASTRRSFPWRRWPSAWRSCSAFPWPSRRTGWTASKSVPAKWCCWRTCASTRAKRRMPTSCRGAWRRCATSTSWTRSAPRIAPKPARTASRSTRPIACAGPLLVSELSALETALEKPARPLLAIVAGSKVSTKLTVLESLLSKVDQLIVGGGITNTFLAALGLQRRQVAVRARHAGHLQAAARAVEKTRHRHSHADRCGGGEGVLREGGSRRQGRAPGVAPRT